MEVDQLYLLDGILMSLSVAVVVGYHVYLWRCVKKKPGNTSLGIQWERRRAWLERTLQGGGGGSMQVVQTLRNNLMIIILRATISITVSTAVAALTNNAYKAATAHVFLGTQSGGSAAPRMFALKFAAAFLVSVSSFLCGSCAVAFLVDTSVLVATASASASASATPTTTHVQRLVDTGFGLAFIANRLMWLTFVVLLWSLGPVAVAVCSLALVWGFSVMDFVDKSLQTSYCYIEEPVVL